MQVYVIVESNDFEYEDEEITVEGVFKTFRNASQHLINKGFTPYVVLNIMQEWVLMFEKGGGQYKNFEAWIEEHELKD